MDSFAKELLISFKCLKKDTSNLSEIKQLATENNCLEVFRHLYRKYGESRQSKYYSEEIIHNAYLGKITKFTLKSGMSIPKHDIDFIKVYQKKLRHLEARAVYEKYLLLEQLAFENPGNSQQIYANFHSTKTNAEQRLESLKKELVDLLKAPEFLHHSGLTKQLCKTEAFFALPDLLRERMKKKDCIDDHLIFVRDFEIFLKVWDKLNVITM